jgi:hypothetical protein
MKIGTLDPVSNAETWIDNLEFYDDGDGVSWDVSTISEVTLKVRDPQSQSVVLSGSYTGGEIDLIGAASAGTYRFEFTADQMGALEPKTYEVGILVTTSDDRVAQLILGYLPVLNGL